MQFLEKYQKIILNFLNSDLKEVISYSRVNIKAPYYCLILLGVVLILQTSNLAWKLVFPVSISNINPVQSEADSERLIYQDLLEDPFSGLTNVLPGAQFDMDAPPTTLSLRLYGIRYSKSGEADAAILGFDPNNQSLYKTNEVIADDIVLEFIEPERVVISRGGIRESVTFAKDTVLSAEVTESLARSNKKDGSSKDLANTSLSGFMNFQPYFSNGTLKGYQIFPGSDSELFTKNGLQSGDLLVSVNGLSINDPSVVKELSSLDQVKLDFIRDEDDFSITVKLN
ncbi:MAG: type II secretion system protein N [Gammaproteobacteria bacterium]|nr:MAG: hypothetical protein EVA53_02995 [Gammaproteobacteria bacterium]